MGLHFFLSVMGYFEWAAEFQVWDGGVLGFLAWQMCFLTGMIGFDWFRKTRLVRSPFKLMTLGWAVFFAGYLFSVFHNAGLSDPCFQIQGTVWRRSACEAFAEIPPFPLVSLPSVVSVFSLSSCSASLGTVLVTCGFTVVMFSLFHWLCDQRKPSIREGMGKAPKGKNYKALDDIPDLSPEETSRSRWSPCGGSIGTLRIFPLELLSAHSLLCYLLSPLFERAWLSILGGAGASVEAVVLCLFAQLVLMYCCIRLFHAVKMSLAL